VVIDGLKFILGKLDDDVNVDGDVNDSDKWFDEMEVFALAVSGDVPITSNSPTTSLGCDTGVADEIGVNANTVEEEVVPYLEE
jgi:hypothetical protein